jgi:hypothetical protein
MNPKCCLCGAEMVFRDFGPYSPLYDGPGASVGYWECPALNGELPLAQRKT